MKRFRQVFAWVLVFAMVCTNVDYAKADAVSGEDIEVVTESAESSVNDLEESTESADSSAEDLEVLAESVDTSEEDPTISVEDVNVSADDSKLIADEADGTEEDTTAPEDVEIVYQGTFRGMIWSIDSNGLLLIDGQYDYEGTDDETPTWNRSYYIEKIESAKVSATGVKSMHRWFDYCENLTSVDMSYADLSGVTDMGYAFYHCENLTSVDMSGVDLSSLADIYSNTKDMFYTCENLTSVDMSNANLSSVTNVYYLFEGCSNLTSVNLSGVNLSGVTRISMMFSSTCTSLTNVDMSNADLSNATTTSSMFYNCSSLKSLNLRGLKTDNVTDMRFMFSGCSSLESLDISDLKTDNVTDMWSMFSRCSSLESLDISDLKTDNVTDMSAMFSGCSSLESLDISDLKTDNVTNMSSMFNGCSSLTSVNLNGLNTENVTNMRMMFENCDNLTSVDLSGLKTDNVTDMTMMFYGCSNLTSVNLSGLDASNVTDMGWMFNGCSSLENLNLNGFKIGSVTDMEGMFSSCSSLTSLDLSGLDVSNVTNMGMMFQNCSSLTELKVSGLDTGCVTNMRSMFLYCSSLTNLDLSGFDTSNVTDMMQMFSGCSSLESLDLSKFKTDNVTDMHYMFHDCSGLTSLKLSGFKTDNVTNMNRMFSGCTSLTSLDLSGLDASNVTDMGGMFSDCTSLTNLDLSGFKTDNVTDMPRMFYNCNSLTGLDLNGFKTDNVTDISWIFYGCSSLESLDVSKFKTDNVTNMYGMFYGCSSLTSLDVSGFNMDNVTNTTNMFTDCGNILKIKAFSNLQQRVVLPVSPMYDTDLQQYNDYFPTGLTRGIWLYVSKSDAENAEPEPEPEPEPQITYTVTFDSGLGDEPIQITDITEGTTISLPTQPVREGYVFQGWFTEPDGKGTAFTEETVVNGDMTVYAYWKAIQSPTEPPEIPETTENAKGFRISKVDPQTYTGSAIKPVIIVYDGEKLLTEKVDYTVSYKNNTKVNDATVEATAPTIIITGKGDYTGKEAVTFPITAKNLNDEDISVADIFATPTSKAQNPVPTVFWQNKKLSNKKDFEVSYPDLENSSLTDAYKAAGVYRVKIKGINNFTGEREIAFHITTATLMSKVKVKAIPKQTYTGSAIEPALTVTCGKATLNLGTDYTVSYKNNTGAGKATAVLTGKGDYAGTKEVIFQIVGSPIAKATVNGLTDKVYNGQEQTQNIQVQLDTKTLTQDKDYQISYTKNLNVGTATVTITGIGGYSGTVKKTFKITAYDLSVDESHLIGGFPKDGMSVSYTKGGSTPEVNISFDGTELVVKKDYTVTYSNNKKITDSTDAKKPTITIKGKGNFKGTKTISFNITKRNLTEEPVDILVSDMPYVNKAGKYISKPVLTDSNGKKLAAGTDYEKTITYTLTDTGEALDKTSIPAVRSSIKVTITGKGSYEGTMEATYRIATSSFSSAKITITPQSYTGSAIALTEKDITVKMGRDTVLTYGKDYEIVEGSYQNNVKKGTASVMIRGVGDYAGTKTVKFKITAKSLK